MTVRCPHCRAIVGGHAVQGGLRLNGLTITLVKADGSVSGPCKHCKREIDIVTGGRLADPIEKAMPSPVRTGRRTVYVVTDDDPS